MQRKFPFMKMMNGGGYYEFQLKESQMLSLHQSFDNDAN